MHPTAYSMPMLASKYLAMGLALEEILPRMTSGPARIMGIDDHTAALRVGFAADIAVFKMIEKKTVFGDRAYGDPKLACISGSKILKPMMTVRKGQIVFRDVEL